MRILKMVNINFINFKKRTIIQIDYDFSCSAVGDFLNNEGSGLYILQSSINHSCVPNAEITFPYGNHRLALKATREINPEDEICISYLDECILERSRHSRQKILRYKVRFFFDSTVSFLL